VRDRWEVYDIYPSGFYINIKIIRLVIRFFIIFKNGYEKIGSRGNRITKINIIIIIFLLLPVGSVSLSFTF